MEGSDSNKLIQEIDRLHSEYEKEIEKLKEKGILSDSTADGFIFHSRNFIRWCKDGFSPVSIGEISKVSGGGVKRKKSAS